MTPKEKAIDLVRDMEFEIPYIHDPTEPQGDDIAKRCALIAVEDIIRLLPNINETQPIYRKSDEFYFQYWQEVKQEIEKL